jgi:AraC-like DNA-binding protein
MPNNGLVLSLVLFVLYLHFPSQLVQSLEQSVKYCPAPLSDNKSFFFDHVHIFWNEQISFHQSAEWEISYIVKGSGTRVVGDVVETFSSGEVIFIPPNMPHGWSFSEFDHDESGKIENITIIFPESLLSKFSNVFPETEPYILQLNQQKKALTFEGDTLKLLQTKMRAMLSQNDLEQLSTLLTIIFRIASSHETRVVGEYQKQNRSKVKLRDVSRFMILNYQRKISLDDVAKELGMNRSSFCTFFRRERGKSFFTVLNEYRIECACQMLRETSMNITEICFATGFEDVPYFNRTFKKLKGETPREYRITHRQKRLI